jgi:hypothetical protein
MKIHISTFALFFWGFMMLYAGLTSDILMICLAVCGLCFGLYWHISHLTSEKEFKEDPIDVMQTYYLKDGTKLRAVPKKDFEIISRSLFATLKQVEKLESGLNIFLDFKISSSMADNVNNLALIRKKVKKMIRAK